MNNLFIIGDVHGHFQTFKALLNKLPENSNILMLGDLIDRGPNSREVINLIKSNSNINTLLGNHEFLLINYLDNKDPYGNFIYNGGAKTLDSYLNNLEFLYKDANWLLKQPIFNYYEFKDKNLLWLHMLL
jgi:serine/threonine protein phosphatase 1